jgi:hypothetical protein
VETAGALKFNYRYIVFNYRLDGRSIIGKELFLMKITIGQIGLIAIAILAGGFLIFAGSKLNWGMVWVLAGIFFFTIGIAAGLLTLAWVLPGPLGTILRLPIVNALILAMVVITMLATVVVGVFFQGR